MNENVEHLARTLWERAGAPEGRDLDFWLAAEMLVLADEQRATHPLEQPSDIFDGVPTAAIQGGD